MLVHKQAFLGISCPLRQPHPQGLPRTLATGASRIIRLLRKNEKLLANIFVSISPWRTTSCRETGDDSFFPILAPNLPTEKHLLVACNLLAIMLTDGFTAYLINPEIVNSLPVWFHHHWMPVMGSRTTPAAAKMIGSSMHDIKHQIGQEHILVNLTPV